MSDDMEHCYATGRWEGATWSTRKVLLCDLEAHHDSPRHYDGRGRAWWSQLPGEDQAVVDMTRPASDLRAAVTDT